MGVFAANYYPGTGHNYGVVIDCKAYEQNRLRTTILNGGKVFRLFSSCYASVLSVLLLKLLFAVLLTIQPPGVVSGVIRVSAEDRASLSIVRA